jgi:ABC-type transporter Mla subunit MlaD
MDPELQGLLKQNQGLLADTLRSTNRLSQLATEIAENQEARLNHLTILADRHNDRLDRVEKTLDRLASLIEQFVRGPRGNGHTPRRGRS